MAPDNGAGAAFAAPRVAHEITDEAADQKGWAKRDPPKQRRPCTAERAPDRTQPAPSRRRPVIALRVLERIGEILVPMVGEVGRAVNRIGQPERQRPAADRLIDAPVPRRMAMNSLVLEVQLPGDDPRAERRQRPPGEIIVEKSGREPQSVYGESERHRRPFDAAFERREFHDLHACHAPNSPPTALKRSRKRCVDIKYINSIDMIMSRFCRPKHMDGRLG